MCGIVGLMGFGPTGLSMADYTIFQQMLYCNALRGMHGTGVFAVDAQGNMSRVRVGGPPAQLFSTGEYDSVVDFVKRRQIRFVVGHNRYATKGKKITEHSHPFRDGHIVLVHNGTLEDYKHLPDYKKYEVDSELLTHSIAVQGIDATIKDLEGAWTIVYWDGKDKTLNILRNDERPLYLAYNTTYKMYGFASEGPMLDWLFQRNYLFPQTVTEVPINTLLSFSLDNPEPKERELKGKPAPVKKDQAYFETMFVEHQDACSTGCGPMRNTNIVAPVKSPAGEWGRGKTGSAGQGTLLQLEDQRNKGKKNYSRRDGGNKQWIGVEHLHSFSKGAWVNAKIVDYDVLGESKDMFQIRCVVDGSPDVDFLCNVKGEATIDALVDAPLGLRGQIFSIMKSTQPPAVCPHKIYLHFPEPVYIVEPEIPQHALVK